MKDNIVRLFILPIGFTICLILFRVFYSGSFMYVFLVWNLFLAVIPLLLSEFLTRISKRNIQLTILTAWLLFFPNALYIITDLLHLKERNNIPLWYDVILIFSTAANGLLIAYVSLSQVEIFLKLKFHKNKAGLILLVCLLLSSFGIYLGRFLRWNSWDIIMNPLGLFSGMLQHFSNPVEHPRTWAMTIIFTMFFSIFYFIIKKIPGSIDKPGNAL